ncbi:unnamed protein product [Fusarium fujikuroi]|nr:unnamed protein product [Fusarium fujikuroi]
MAQALNIEGIDSSVVLLVAGSGLAEPGVDILVQQRFESEAKERIRRVGFVLFRELPTVQSESVSAAARACERSSRIGNPKCLSAWRNTLENVFIQLTKLATDVRLEKRAFQGVQSILKMKPLSTSVDTIVTSRHSVSGRRVAWLHLGLGQPYRLGWDGTLMGGRTRGIPVVPHCQGVPCFEMDWRDSLEIWQRPG